MIPPVSVCHQLSWNGLPKASTPQTTASGLSGSPTLAIKRKLERSNCPGDVRRPAFISMRMAVGAVYQTETFCCFEDTIPAFGVELGLVNDQCRAVGQRRDDAVGGARDPSRIGGAPEDVIRHADRARDWPVI